MKGFMNFAIKCFASAIVLASISAFIIDLSQIPTNSMYPTINSGSYVLVNEIPRHFKSFSKGDIVSFFPPQDDKEVKKYKTGSQKVKFIKRLVALEGDTIETLDGILYVNGEKVDIGYDVVTDTNYVIEKTIIPKGHCYLLGDNRINSHDSQEFGFIKITDLIGTVNH